MTVSAPISPENKDSEKLPNNDLMVGRFGLLFFFFNSAAEP
jgi:hypothetical protein